MARDFRQETYIWILACNFWLNGFGHCIQWSPRSSLLMRLLSGLNVIVNVYKMLSRRSFMEPAPRACSCCFQESQSGSGIVYKHVLHAFESFFQTLLLIVNGLSLGCSFWSIVYSGCSACWFCTHKPTWLRIDRKTKVVIQANKGCSMRGNLDSREISA